MRIISSFPYPYYNYPVLYTWIRTAIETRHPQDTPMANSFHWQQLVDNYIKR